MSFGNSPPRVSSSQQFDGERRSLPSGRTHYNQKTGQQVWEDGKFPKHASPAYDRIVAR